MFEPVPEAPLADSPAGRVPETDGWFIVNVAEGAGSESDRYGRKCRFSPGDSFPEFAINVRILQRRPARHPSSSAPARARARS